MRTRSAARRRANARRRRFFFSLVLLVFLLGGGIWAWQASNSARRLVPAGSNLDFNAAMIQNTLKVQQAIEAYAQAHGGQVPQDATAVDREIVQGPLLAELPDSPWGSEQKHMVQATDQLREALANGTDIGPAEVPKEIRGVTDLGALCYEAVGPQSYRLYGIGHSKEGKAAVIIQLGTPPSKR